MSDVTVIQNTITAPVTLARGENGLSAYEVYLENTTDDPPLTEQQWLDSLGGEGGHDPVTITGNGLSLTGQQLSLSIGTGSTQVAAGNHTHAQLHDAVTISGNGLSLTGQQLSLSIGTGSTQVAAGNHTHAQLHDAATVSGFGLSISGQQISFTSLVGGNPVTTGHVPTADGNGGVAWAAQSGGASHAAATVSGNGISITGQEISLSIGTGPTQVAAGNHTHAQLHDAVTITGNGLSLTGQQLSLSIGTGATDVAAGNHTHAQLHDAVTISGDGLSLTGQQLSLSIGTGATQVAAGNHTHAQLHDAVTITGNGLSLTGQQLSLSIGTGATDVAAGNHSHSGTYAPLAAKRHVFWPAGAAIPRTTNGAAPATVETGTNDVMYDVFDFDSATDEGIAWVGYLEHWGAGTIKVKPVWTCAAGIGGANKTVCFAFAGRAYDNDDALDQSGGTAQTSTDTWIADGDVHIGPATAAITIAGTPANGKLLHIQCYRDVSEDDLAGDARLLGVWIEYTESSTEEAAW